MDIQVLHYQLSAIVGSDHITSSADIAVPRYWSSQPVLAVSPVTPGEICEIVRAVEAANCAIVPIGGTNLLESGYPPSPDRPYIVLSTVRMKRVLDYQPDDLTITCEAGATPGYVEETLVPRRQTLALDGPLPNTSTLGGMVATATAGVRRHAYGTPRDVLIGLRAVMSGGIEVKGGGKVVKNVAGYDVCKLFTGSRGSLGVLTELTFKVRPLPEVTRTLAWEVTDISTAAKLGFDLHLDRLAATMILAVSDSNGGAPALIVRLEGAAARVEWQAEQFQHRLTEAGVHSTPHELSLREVADLNDWPASHRSSGTVCARIAVLPTQLADLACRISKIPTASILADCTVGVLHCSLTRVDGTTSSAITSALPIGANCAWTSAEMDFDADSTSITAQRGARREDLQLQRALKTALDPKNTFSPGRFPAHEV